MSVYVDCYRVRYRGMVMSHMMADTETELDAMADAIGVARRWKQTKPGRPPHYDVCESKRRAAMRLGAVEVSPKGLVKKMLSNWLDGSTRRDDR